VFTTEQMIALCGAHLIDEQAYLRSFLPSCTDKDHNRESIALPCDNPEGNHVKHILMTTLYSHERYSYEEVIEEIKLPLFSADASSSQHTPFEAEMRLLMSIPGIEALSAAAILAIWETSSISQKQHTCHES
jgi:hypothetical protein